MTSIVSGSGPGKRRRCGETVTSRFGVLDMAGFEETFLQRPRRGKATARGRQDGGLSERRSGSDGSGADGLTMVTGTGAVARDVDDHALSTYLERHLSGSDAAVRLVDGLLAVMPPTRRHAISWNGSPGSSKTSERCCVRSSTASIMTKGSCNEASASQRAWRRWRRPRSRVRRMNSRPSKRWRSASGGNGSSGEPCRPSPMRTSVSTGCRSVRWRARPRTRNGSWSACGSGPSLPRYCADRERGRAMSGGDDHDRPDPTEAVPRSRLADRAGRRQPAFPHRFLRGRRRVGGRHRQDGRHGARSSGRRPPARRRDGAAGGEPRGSVQRA